MTQHKSELSKDRYFDPDPAQRAVARELYVSVAYLPLICPHGHVDARLPAGEEATFGTPRTCSSSPITMSFACSIRRGSR